MVLMFLNHASMLDNLNGTNMVLQAHFFTTLVFVMCLTSSFLRFLPTDLKSFFLILLMITKEFCSLLTYYG